MHFYVQHYIHRNVICGLQTNDLQIILLYRHIKQFMCSLCTSIAYQLVQYMVRYKKIFFFFEILFFI